MVWFRFTMRHWQQFPRTLLWLYSLYYSGLGEQPWPPFSRKKHANLPNLSPLTSPRLHNVTLERTFEVSSVVLCEVSNVKVSADSPLTPSLFLLPPLYRCRSELFQHRGAVRCELLLFKVERRVSAIIACFAGSKSISWEGIIHSFVSSWL